MRVPLVLLLVASAVAALVLRSASAQSRVSAILEHTPEVVGPNHYRYTATHTYGLGRTVSLTYDMQYGDFVQVLTTQQASAVVCSAPTAAQQTLTVTYAVGVTPSLAVNDVAVGAASWGCVSQYGDYAAPFYRRIVSVVSQSAGSATAGAVVTYAVSVASWVDLCEECTLQHRVNDLPSTTQETATSVSMEEYASALMMNKRSGAKAGAEDEEAVAAAEARGWFHHFFHSVTHVFHTVVHDVVHVVHNVVHDVTHVITDVIHTIADAIKLLSGNIDIDKNILSFSANWNYNSGSGSASRVIPLYSKHFLNNALDVEVACTNCYMATDATLNFQLHISHFSLQTIEVTLSGSAAGQAVVNGMASLQWSDNGNIHVATLNFPSINFMAGPIPVHIAFSMPVNVLWSVGVSATATASIAMKANGQVHYGIAYGQQPSQWTAWQPADGSYGWHKLAAHSMSFSASANTQANAQVTTQVTLVPQLQVSIEGLGGPNFAVEPWLRGVVAAHATGNAALNGGASADFSATVSVYGGLDITVGATFHIPIIDHTWSWGPHQILDVNRLLWTHTYSGAAGRSIGGRVPLAAGDTPRPAPTGSQTCASVCTIASGLSVCAHLNGMPVCSDGTDFAAREQLVIEALRNHTSSGLACVQQLAPLLCNTQFKMCADAASAPGTAIVNVCVSQCTNALQSCGATPDVVSMTCQALVASPDFAFVDESQACVGSALAEPPTSSVYGMTCGVASGLTTCSMMNGRSVAFSSLLFTSLADVDAFVAAQLTANGASAASAECAATSKNLMCAEYMPECASNGQVLALCPTSCANQLTQCTEVSNAASMCSGAGLAPPFSYYVANDLNSACGHVFLAGAATPAVATVPASSVALGAGLGGALALAVIIALSVVVAVQCVRLRGRAARVSSSRREVARSVGKDGASPALLADASL